MKKRFEKVLALMLVVVMTLAMVTGCGTKKEETEPAATEAATTQATAAATEAATASATTDSVAGALKGVTLNVGTSGLFGPFSYYDKDGKTLIGFDIDMINALSDLLGFEIKGDIQAMDYSALTTSVAEGKLDMAMAALCVTDERKEVMDFSDVYCDSGQVVMVNSEKNSGIASVDDLKGKTVAVEKGTASHAYASKNLADSKLEVHDTITTAYESLEQGKVDAVIQDGPGAAFYIKTTEGSKLKVVGDEFNQGQAPYAIAFVKDFKYTDQFNQALKELKDNGTMDKLLDKWCK